MATVNLGAIKFNWKGAYDNSTTYAVDDVVSSGGSSYICILASQGNAVSNGTYWNQMSSAGTNGTNGTDVGTTITTQGDLLYRDGSGLQRLAAGTNGQLLKTGGSGANPSWTDAPSGKIKQIKVAQAASVTSSSVTTSSMNTMTNSGNNHISISITPTSTSHKLIIMANAPSTVSGNDNGLFGVYVNDVPRGAFVGGGSSDDGTGCAITCWDNIDNTNAHTVEFRAIGAWSGNAANLGYRRGTNSISMDGMYGTMTVMEVEVA
jgi:hypothetical protein